jgi:exopolysaccharide biosynthesis polyprenyl glycosylphosphotransferase
MDGSTSTGEAARTAGASDVGAVDFRSSSIALDDGSVFRERLSGAIAAGQLACFALLILTDLLNGRNNGPLSTGIFTNSMLLLCGFAFQVSMRAKKRNFYDAKDMFLEMGQRGLQVAALVFVSVVLSNYLNDASWEELKPARMFVLLLAIACSGPVLLAMSDLVINRVGKRCVVVFGDGQPTLLLAQQIRREMTSARVCLFPMAQLVRYAGGTRRISTPIYADPRLVELAPEVAVITSVASDEAMDRLAARLAPLSLDVLMHIPHGGRWGLGQMVTFAGMPFVRIFPKPLKLHQAALKRAFDIVASLSLIVLLSPLLCCVAVAIKLDSRGPVLFWQPRVGRGGTHFTVCKFRTMRTEAADVLADQPTVSNDPRVTRIGGFLRKSSIDELPQLFNVLMGSMSMVGPRPHAMNGNAFSVVVANYHARHRVKPGITGLAQVLGWRGPADTRAKIEQRVAYDLRYISEWSFVRDLLILGRTIFALYGKNAF